MTTTMTPPERDIDLVEAAQAGSSEAFRAIVERYHERLATTVYRILADRADTEEVVQEVFLRAYRNLQQFQRDSAVYTWLYRIAVNASVDLRKKRRRRRHLSLQDEELGLESSLPDGSAGPGDEPERAELVALVREGIASLPDHYRVILMLREYGDKTYEELTEILEIPKGTVESRLFRARSKLRDWLVERVGERGAAWLEELGS